MARVNDGSLLQHFTECHAAACLARAGSGRLRLVATHAMAPWEPARGAATHVHNERARALLSAAGRGVAAPDAPAVLRAYAACHASLDRYPNTAELLAALLGREALAGVLCETEAAARGALDAAWRGSAVRVEGCSWREALGSGALFPPEELDRPWLFSMDPYTWLLDGEAKKEERGPYLVREDFEALRPCVTAHVKSGRPGAFCAFVYQLDKTHASGFRRQALRLADRLGLERAVLGTPAPDGTRHLAVVMSSLEDLAAGVAEAWHDLLAQG